ncbi:hypothetical protein SMACR_07958 [Sordaria macrospora]|uniref:WGS project CABT00000000 data, contig 2.48 n=2 Tax=Sordaria macrospora TaxID=5147 RepID=F7W908_SORMK|nr:uncharacterized protein SMAC_07958 [Sordaria macrospora k-hell]KAA8631960.1 hypothetical protein SMACR_07958 [Sordaria macrospora]WPJ61139.1 hypothetical protein SMAC4_07958 [Sordaria macrospora]CCC13889.1 unnamed protein product [Sordaria macrospora k-hell]
MPPPPPWLSKPSNLAYQTSHAPMSPTIKEEPGAAEPLYAIAQADPMPGSAKRKTRSDSHSGSPSQDKGRKKKLGRLNPVRERKVKASETWQYINRLVSAPITVPAFPKTIRAVLQLPRKRDLPDGWKHRLALEKPSFANMALLINYLNGDAPTDSLCNSSAGNCAGKWETAGPALASLEEGKGTIYKDCAFPRCVFFPIVNDEHQSSKRICCNAFYRSSNSPSTPNIWSPPNLVHGMASFLTSSLSASSSSIKKEPGTEESPIAQQIMKTNSFKREREDDDPSESGPRKKQRQQNNEADEEGFEKLQIRVKATETWQYLNCLTHSEPIVPKISKGLVKLLETDGARKRNLPIAWQRRLAIKRPSRRITKLLLNFLTGDNVSDHFVLCNLPGANCREKWITVSPAVEGMQQGKPDIYREIAFYCCVLFESRSGQRKCCNAVYRGFHNPPMPDVWSPPTSAPVSAPTLVPTPVLSLVLSPAPSSSSYSSSSSSSLSESSSPSPSRSSSPYSPPPATTMNTGRALPANSYPGTPSHQIVQGTPAQCQTGTIAILSAQRNVPNDLFTPGSGKPHIRLPHSYHVPLNATSLTTSQGPTSHAHSDSASRPQQSEQDVLPIGTDGATLQTLDLPNMGATVPLPSNGQNLAVIVHEGNVEVILEDVAAFTQSRGDRWAVEAGKECRVRNLHTGSKAVLFVVGIPVRRNNE